MKGIEGKPDPLKALPADELPGGHATEVLDALREVDYMETRVVPLPVVSRPQRPWFREDQAATPWGPRSAPQAAPERRVERTGKLRIPEQYQLDALRQEVGMRLRDTLVHIRNLSTVGEIMIRNAWTGIQGIKQAAHEELDGVADDERKAREADYRGERLVYQEFLAELDAYGLEKGFPSSIARKLGSDMTRHRVTPWGALAVLEGRRDPGEPVHWTPPPRPA